MHTTTYMDTSSMVTTMRQLESFAPPLKPSFERTLAISKTRVRRFGHAIIRLTTPNTRLV